MSNKHAVTTVNPLLHLEATVVIWHNINKAELNLTLHDFTPNKGTALKK